MLTIHDLSREVDMTAVRGGIGVAGQISVAGQVGPTNFQQNVGDFDRRHGCDRDEEEERHGDCGRERHEGWHRRGDQKFDIASCGYQG